MAVSSEFPLAAEGMQAALHAESLTAVDLQRYAGEEFPADLPGDWDRMLQPSLHRSSRLKMGLVAVTVSFLLIVVCVGAFYWLHKSLPTVMAAPASSSR